VVGRGSQQELSLPPTPHPPPPSTEGGNKRGWDGQHQQYPPPSFPSPLSHAHVGRGSERGTGDRGRKKSTTTTCSQQQYAGQPLHQHRLQPPPPTQRLFSVYGVGAMQEGGYTCQIGVGDRWDNRGRLPLVSAYSYWRQFSCQCPHTCMTLRQKEAGTG